MSDYPRFLRLDEFTAQRLVSYLETELLNHYAERGVWVDRLLAYQKDYWAEPTNRRATFPFTGASTLVIPLTATAVEAVHARTMTTMFALNQLVSAQARAAAWEDFARPVERFLDHELLKEMKIRRRLDSAILEIEKFGTGIGKVGYEKIIKMAVRQIGEIEQEIPIVVRDGAVVDPVAGGRFLMPFSAADPQTAPWCGEEHSKSPYEVLCLEQSGFFYEGTFDRIKAWISTSQQTATGVERKFARAQEELEGRKAVWPNLIDWVELWLEFNVDGGSHAKDIVVHYHRPSQQLMSCRYNWHEDLHRPYRVGVYFPVEHRWTGIGICKQNEQFQKEVTTQHRQRLDNATLANMRMIKVSKLSGYKAGEPIFPGKMWFLDDMSHVDTLQLGEIYNSAYNNEQATLMYSQQRTGVNDVVLGQPQVGTPGTATGDLARIQEGAKKFDYAYQNIKEFVQDLIVDAACVIQQFGPRRLEYYDVVEGGKMVQQFFDMPVELIRSGLLIELNTAGQQQNKILDRQNWVQVSTLLQQYYVGMLQLAAQTGNQQLVQYITEKGLVAGTEAMQQILESFDIRNVDRIILAELLKMPGAAGGQLANAGGNGLGATQPGANGGPNGAGQTSGMDQLASLVQTLGGGGAAGDGRLLLNRGGV
jgi:hypothetical protein